MASGLKYTHLQRKGKGKFAAFLECENREWQSLG